MSNTKELDELLTGLLAGLKDKLPGSIAAKLLRVGPDGIEQIASVNDDDDIDRKLKISATFRDDMKKLKATGMDKEQGCFIAHVYASSLGDSFGSFVGHCMHLAEQHDNLEAAQAAYHCAHFLYKGAEYMSTLDEKHGTHFMVGDDLKNARRCEEKTKELLVSVKAKHDLANDVSKQ